MEPSGTDRRTVLATVVGSVTAASVAGCLGGGSDGEADESAPVVDAADSLENTTDPEAWRDVREIRFDGWVGGWVGAEPAAIDRVENPTLVLVAGREYELTWENMDGIHHNIAFWDVDWEVVGDYSSDGTEVVGERETLAFEATPEMDTYRCEYQPVGQRGDVVILEGADDSSTTD